MERRLRSRQRLIERLRATVYTAKENDTIEDYKTGGKFEEYPDESGDILPSVPASPAISTGQRQTWKQEARALPVSAAPRSLRSQSVLRSPPRAGAGSKWDGNKGAAAESERDGDGGAAANSERDGDRGAAARSERDSDGGAAARSERDTDGGATSRSEREDDGGTAEGSERDGGVET